MHSSAEQFDPSGTGPQSCIESPLAIDPQIGLARMLNGSVSKSAIANARQLSAVVCFIVTLWLVVFCLNQLPDN